MPLLEIVLPAIHELFDLVPPRRVEQGLRVAAGFDAAWPRFTPWRPVPLPEGNSQFLIFPVPNDFDNQLLAGLEIIQHPMYVSDFPDGAAVHSDDHITGAKPRFRRRRIRVNFGDQHTDSRGHRKCLAQTGRERLEADPEGMAAFVAREIPAARPPRTKCSIHRLPASSSPEKRTPIPRGRWVRTAVKIAAMAPLVSALPSPRRSPSFTRAASGSPLQPALAGTADIRL